MRFGKPLFDDAREAMTSIHGVLIDLPPPAAGDDGFATLRVIAPPGTTIPLHSRPDRAVIVVGRGRLRVWSDGGWKEAGPGDLVDMRPATEHAIRNEGEEDVEAVLITTQRLRQFIADMASRTDAPSDKGSRLRDVADRAEAYGFRMAEASRQSAIGPDCSDAPEEGRAVPERG